DLQNPTCAEGGVHRWEADALCRQSLNASASKEMDEASAGANFSFKQAEWANSSWRGGFRFGDSAVKAMDTAPTSLLVIARSQKQQTTITLLQRGTAS
ncbi:MAG: hypothetical protein ACOYM5_15665, partial [Caulobacter sp.]